MLLELAIEEYGEEQDTAPREVTAGLHRSLPEHCDAQMRTSTFMESEGHTSSHDDRLKNERHQVQDGEGHISADDLDSALHDRADLHRDRDHVGRRIARRLCVLFVRAVLVHNSQVRLVDVLSLVLVHLAAVQRTELALAEGARKLLGRARHVREAGVLDAAERVRH